ncbi:hypothetical protein [Streptomyces bathyalis]|nr:hypothetical protein [Streptomyces bathyalis]
MVRGPAVVVEMATVETQMPAKSSRTPAPGLGEGKLVMYPQP